MKYNLRQNLLAILNEYLIFYYINERYKLVLSDERSIISIVTVTQEITQRDIIEITGFSRA